MWSDIDFPKYSRAHVAMSIMVAWWFLKQYPWPGLNGHAHSAAVSPLCLYAILWTVDGEIPQLFAILKILEILVFELTDNSLTKLGIKWWTTTRPCLQRQSLWWMLHWSPQLLPVKLLIVEPSRTVTCNLFSLVLPLYQIFLSVWKASHSVVFYIYKIQSGFVFQLIVRVTHFNQNIQEMGRKRTSWICISGDWDQGKGKTGGAPDAIGNPEMLHWHKYIQQE